MAKGEKAAKAPSCSFEALEKAGSLPIKIGDTVVGVLTPRKFESGTYGYGLYGPANLPLPGGQIAVLQMSANFIVKHSASGVPPLEIKPSNEESAA